MDNASKPLRIDLSSIIDLSHTIYKGMPVYIGDPEPSLEFVKTIERNGVNLSRLSMGSHNGTHVDAPKHFLEDGLSVDALGVSLWVGEAVALDLSSKPFGSAITSEDLSRYEGIVRKGDIVLIYTGCSKKWGEEGVLKSYTYLDESAAAWLMAKGVKAVGIDCLSVEKFRSQTRAVHKMLLRGGVGIIESINGDLERLLGQRFLLVCLPLKLKDGEGAPARAVAIPIIP